MLSGGRMSCAGVVCKRTKKEAAFWMLEIPYRMHAGLETRPGQACPDSSFDAGGMQVQGS